MTDHCILSTYGKTIHPGLELAIWYNPSEHFLPEMGRGDRFRLVLVTGGTGILRIGQTRECFMAPVVFCLNEKDDLALEQDIGLAAQSVYFHPGVVDSMFTFANLRDGDDRFQSSQYFDWNALRAFVPDSPLPDVISDIPPRSSRQLPAGPLIAHRLGGLMTRMAQELETQPTSNWPCRSHSYFMEMLFVVDYVYRHPDEDVVPISRVELSGPDDEIGQVILYLHANYAGQVTLEQLASHFHTNRTTLCERFRSVTGFSIMDYLTRLRLQLGGSLLRDTLLPVTEIAARVGYQDATTFGRAFRRHTRYAPSEYREHHSHWLSHLQ